MIMFAATMVYGGGHYHPEARRLSAQRDTAIQMDGEKARLAAVLKTTRRLRHRKILTTPEVIAVLTDRHGPDRERGNLFQK